MIKKKFWKENFSFEVFTEGTVAHAIKNLPTSKASVSNDIPVSIMKEIIDTYCHKSWMTVWKTIFLLWY